MQAQHHRIRKPVAIVPRGKGRRGNAALQDPLKAHARFVEHSGVGGLGVGQKSFRSVGQDCAGEREKMPLYGTTSFEFRIHHLPLR